MVKKGIKREEILSRGMELMTIRGYHGTGVKDIVAAAGVPKGSFYSYFESKEDLAVQALDRYAEDCSREMAPLLGDPSVPPLRRIRNLFEERVRCQLEELDFSRGCFISKLAEEMAGVSRPVQAAAARALARLNGLLVEVLWQAQDAGEIDSGRDAEELALFIDAAWRGALAVMKAQRSAEPLHHFMTVIFEMLLVKSAVKS